MPIRAASARWRSTKVGSEGTGTNLVILKTLDDNGNVVPEDHRLALRNKANQLWHTDSPFKRLPALASVLSSRIIPGRGGETEFVSTRLAFERLDPALRTRLENSFAWHDYAYSRGKIAPGLASPEERAALPPHAGGWSGKIRSTAAARFTSPRMPMRSKAWKTAAGKSFCGELMDAATAPGVSYVHTWHKGDVIMWDNRATMHRGRPWPANEPRYMVRTTISASAADGLEFDARAAAAGGRMSARPPQRGP